MGKGRMTAWFGFVIAIVAIALLGNVGDVAAQAQGRTVTLTVHYRKCAEVPADGDYFTACHDNPVPDSYIAVYKDVAPGSPDVEGTTDAAGNVTFMLYAGTYSLVGAPGDFLDASMIFCSRDQSPGESIGYPFSLGTGDSATCDYYIVPGCNAADGDCTPDSTPPDSNSGADDDTENVSTLPNTGSGSVSQIDLASSLWPLAGAAFCLTMLAFRVRHRRA